MLGERTAIVLEVKPWEIHGVPHVDVSLVYADHAVGTARLGRDSVPADLRPGEEVLVSLAMSVIVSIRRPEA